jgi:hypothetical protein
MVLDLPVLFGFYSVYTFIACFLDIQFNNILLYRKVIWKVMSTNEL